MHSYGLLVGLFPAREIAMTVRFTETFCSCLKLSLLILATPRPQSQYSTSPEKKALYFRHTQPVLLQQHPSATTKALGHHRARGDTACSLAASDSTESQALGALWLFSQTGASAPTARSGGKCMKRRQVDAGRWGKRG